ncbi:unnamed protein product, partial [Mesorhabditis belari]|uniref:Cytochrome P450 n=1 Tax=Mesorhabditis belari TaxID=2138241 RepID=A0AAF3F1I6_9BILA
MLLIVFILLAWILWSILVKTSVGKNGKLQMPPSPRGQLPILGHLWRFDPTRPFRTIDKWAKELGDVITVYFGSTPVIVLSRQRVIREAFLKEGENFSGRPSLFVHESCWGKGHVISDGPRNSLLRRHLLAILRSKCRGVDSIQELVTVEIKRMHEYIEKQMGKNDYADIFLEDTVFYVVGNVLTQLVLGRRHEHGSIEFRESARWLDETTRLMEKSSALTFLPWLRHLPGGGLGYAEMKTQAKRVQDLMREDIHDRRRSGEYKDPSRTDLTSVFMRKIDEEMVGNEDLFSDEMLVRLMTEMFFAGIQTECNTFGWAFLYFLFYPEVQRECRQQILEALDSSEEILWNEKDRIPYLEATVAEVQRLANIAPFSMPHKNHEETTLDGYRIPAGSLIFMNLYTTLLDDHVFENAKEFRPERFLNGLRLDRARMAASMPYGIGPRMCMGESIARLELFCVIGSLLRTYSFEQTPGEKYSLDQKMELTIHPSKYRIRVRKLARTD